MKSHVLALAALALLAAALFAGARWLVEETERQRTLALLARTPIASGAPSGQKTAELVFPAPPAMPLPEPVIALPPPAPRAIGKPANAAPRPDRLSDTLRLCRSAGYHASQCLQRGCSATRYGLACRG